MVLLLLLFSEVSFPDFSSLDRKIKKRKITVFVCLCFTFLNHLSSSKSLQYYVLFLLRKQYSITGIRFFKDAYECWPWAFSNRVCIWGTWVCLYVVYLRVICYPSKTIIYCVRDCSYKTIKCIKTQKLKSQHLGCSPRMPQYPSSDC